MSDKEYKPVKDMTFEEFTAWLESPYDPADPRLSYDHEAWLQTSALLEQRRALDDMARQNANKPPPIPRSAHTWQNMT